MSPLSLHGQSRHCRRLPGLVIGLNGESKHVDTFGRVGVRFPWRKPAFTNNVEGDTGWVRVAQIATGVGRTTMWIPDSGDEVVRAFEHGDPRRPVIIGSMWDGKDLPPSSLLAIKFRAVFQSRSESGGFNEIVLNDTTGQEPLLLRSGNQFRSISSTGLNTSSTINILAQTALKSQSPTDLQVPTRPSIRKR